MKDKGKNSLIYTKNWISKIFFYYIGKLINYGKINSFDFKTIPNIENHLQYSNQKKNFFEYIQKNKKRSLKKNIFLYILPKWLLLLFGFLFSYGMYGVVPVWIRFYINSFTTPFQLNNAILYGSIIFLILIIRAFVSQNAVLFGFKSICLMYSIFSTIISNKIGRLSNESKNKINIGQITSFLTVDIERIAISLTTSHHLIVSPFLIILYTVILALEIGYYALIAPLMIIFFLCILYILIFPLNKYSKTKLEFGDKRGKLINETVQGIKIIKINAWENIMLNKIFNIRKLEKTVIVLINFIKQFQDGIINIVPTFIGFIVISIYNYNEDNLTVGSVIYLIIIFNYFISPLQILIASLINFIDANIGLNRLEEFNNLEELDQNELNKFDKNLQEKNSNLEIGEVKIKGSFYYEKNFFEVNMKTEKEEKQENINIIKNFDLNIKPGEFIGIVGKVGAGKTSILKVILNEWIPNHDSKCDFIGDLSYVPQESFLINDTLKNNIVFGNDLDEKEYKNILNICQLEDDLKLLPGGDLTEIGERGINLSGGQKQRISIARSIYNNSDIYLIDDALSALDAEIGQKIFNKVFLDKLKKNGKTIILATHALQFLYKMDKIILLENGEIKNIGSYNELLNKDKEFKSLIETHINKNDRKNSLKKENNERKLTLDNNVEENNDKKIEDGKIIKKENEYFGLVKFDIIKKYVNYGGKCLFFSNLSLIMLYIVVKFFGDFWIISWSRNTFGLTNNQYFLYFCIIVIFIILIRLLGSLFFGIFSGNVSYNIFNDLMNKIIKKRLAFFDTTPIGQLLNLTTKDIDFVDIAIPFFFGQFLNIGVTFLGTIVFISVTNVIIIPIFVVGILIIIKWLVDYLKSAIKMRRLIQLAYSPLLSNVNEFLNGFNIFKVYNKLEFQKTKFNKNSENIVNIIHLENLLKLWINFRLDIILVTISGFLIFFIIIGFNFQLTFVINNVELIGLSISYTLLINSLTIIFLVFTTESIKGMSNTERLILNVDNKNLEDSWLEPQINKKDWLIKNNMKIENLSVKYRENLPNVLKNLNFEVKNNEKLALVGRTGSGKSSFILALMRLLRNEGKIIIDDIDIDSIGLHHLRKNLKLIPQDPFIIEGSLRENIDPINSFKDVDIKIALQTIFEKDLEFFSKNENGNDIDFLDYKVNIGGSNLSFGQKQLICITRILLEKPKILLMDEATSNIDFELDKKIQDIIKEKFKDSIIITIAHRLNTIIHYDKVIFLKNGKIKEMGSPKELLKNEESFFYNLVLENGKDFLNKMKKIVN